MSKATEPGLSHAALAHIARDLTDKGMLIEAGFVSMRLACMPRDTPADQLHEMRLAFFAGAQHLFGSLMSILDPGEDPTDADMGRMESIQAELQCFIQDFELRHLPAEGQA